MTTTATKKTLLRAALLAPALAALAVAAPLNAQESGDEAGVRAAVELYLASHATGEGTHVAGAFHPELVMYFVRDGALMSRTAADYIAGFRGTPAADEAERRRWIESVDVTGSAATAKVVLDYPQVRITDYFTLLRIDGTWTIMNKVFHAEPKPTGTP